MEQKIKELMKDRHHVVVEDVEPATAAEMVETARSMKLWAHSNKVQGQRELDVVIATGGYRYR